MVVRPKGQLDLHNGTALRQTLCDICPNRFPCWVIDLTDVDSINSAGLTALVKGLSLANEKRCRVAIYNPRPAVKLVFEITRLDELFEVIEGSDFEIETVDFKTELAPDLDRAAIAQAA